MAQDRDPAEAGMMDTIVAPATPPGFGALGVVRVGGPGARRVAAELLGLDDPEPRRALTRVVRRKGKEIDRVVAVFWEAERSPIGEDLLEMSAHGSPEILRALVEAAIASGARPAEPGEFTRRAFTNGRLDLAQAEAVEALISARGERARRSALARLEGGLSRPVAAARARILGLLAHIEACLDNPDSDLPPLPDPETALAGLEIPLRRLLAAYERGGAERNGLRVALVGRPNAGKSSLLNALLGRDRAIVAPTPGTTRDTLEEAFSLAGLAATLIDTAGLRDDCGDAAEREGVARAERALSSCDVAVLVVDAARAPDAEDARVLERVSRLASRGGRPVVVALNKTDLVADPSVLSGGHAVSASTGSGLEALSRALAAAAGAAPTDEGESLLIGTRDRGLISEALVEVEAARAAVASHPGAWDERAAAHLRTAHARLGLILGEDAPDEVLRAVFARFCVGK